MRHVVACECVCCSALGLFPRRQQGWKMGTRLPRLPARPSQAGKEQPSTSTLNHAPRRGRGEVLGCAEHPASHRTATPRSIPPPRSTGLRWRNPAGGGIKSGLS